MTPTDLHPNDDGAVVRPADPWRRERVLVVGVVMALVFFRCFVLVFFEGSSFDSDQALIGLMAKHLVEGRAFPVFTYGQPYMLGVEAWMAAPFFLVGGTTVTMLKLPLLLVNLAVGVILVLLAERELRLRPALALVPALFFVLMAPGTSTLLLQASGGNVEPFLYVLLLWVLRRRPLAFGAVLAFGVLQREFTIYAFGATAALALFDRSLFRRANWQPIALGLVAFCATWQGIYLLKQYSSIDGPGTSVDRVLSGGSGNVEALLGRVCVDPGRALDGLSRLAPRYAADLFGAHPRPLGDFQINSFVYQGTSWLGILLLIGFVLATLRVAWLLWRRRLAPWHPAVWFATYLWLIGLQAGLGHVALRCGEVSIPTMRYSLLAVFGAVGLVGAHLALEPSRRLRAVAVVLTLVWAGVSFMGYARLTAEYAWQRPPDERRLLADYMVEHGIRYARANFWDALHITFYTDERAIVASTTNVFLYEYQWVVGEQAGDVPTIARDRCPGGIRVARAYYLCPPGEP